MKHKEAVQANMFIEDCFRTIEAHQDAIKQSLAKSGFKVNDDGYYLADVGKLLASSPVVKFQYRQRGVENEAQGLL